MIDRMTKLHHLIETHAEERNLESVKKALPLMKQIMEVKGQAAVREKYQHALAHSYEVCVVIMDMHPAITAEEEDILYTSILLHIYPENFPVEDLENLIIDEMGFSSEIYKLVRTIIPGKNWTDEEYQQYYVRIQENRLALLAAMADRANMVQDMYRLSTWNAHRCIEETKIAYYPMGIYGKEHYHELRGPITILMEKTRTLLDVSEILLQRYETREAELIRDIQAMREENATLKSIIQEYEAE